MFALRSFLAPESPADRYRVGLNAHDNRVCNGTSHILTCLHSVTLSTRACSTSCRRPQFGVKTRRPHVCSICAHKTDEENLLQGVAAIRDLQAQVDALRNNYTNPPSSLDMELLDDLIIQSGTNLQFSVNQKLWSLYLREGEEGVKRHQEAREAEEAATLERRYVQVMRREWYNELAADVERTRENINELAAAGFVSDIQTMIADAQGIIDRHASSPGYPNLVSAERARLNVEFAHDRLQTLRAALTVAEGVGADEAERHRAAERRRRVEQLECLIEMSEASMESVRQSRASLGEEDVGGGALHSLLFESTRDLRREVERLRAEGLGDPSEQDTEPGEV